MSIKKCGGFISSEAVGGIKQQGVAPARSDEPVLFIEFRMTDGRLFGFPYSQLMQYRLEESAGSDVYPQKLTLEFSRHDVVITGRRLFGLRQLLQVGRLARICEMNSRYAEIVPDEPFIATVQVKSAIAGDA